MSDLSITLLGTGSPMPDPNRAGPSTLVTAGSSHYLVDAGRGVLMRLAGAGVGAVQLAGVLLTHLHSDHLTDLSDVITTRWVMSFEPTPLTIVGPPGTRQVVDHLLAALAELGHDDTDAQRAGLGLRDGTRLRTASDRATRLRSRGAL